MLIGFASEDDWFEYRLEHHPEFLRRIADARAALRDRPAGGKYRGRRRVGAGELLAIPGGGDQGLVVDDVLA